MNNHIFHDQRNKRIDILDSRYYTKDNKTFYPGVTTVLNVYPKNFGYFDWLKSNGYNSDIILQRSADEGSAVHNLIDRYLKGEEVLWMNEDGSATVELKLWEMFLRFVEFWEREQPELLCNEQIVISEKHELGGTLDLLCRIKGELWLIDAKTSNYLHATHELQLAAYAMMWNEQHPELSINRCGVMWLKAQTRGEDRKGETIQGKGWKLHEFDRPYREAFKLFEHTHAIWKELNPDYKPANLSYSDRAQLKAVIA